MQTQHRHMCRIEVFADNFSNLAKVYTSTNSYHYLMLVCVCV